MQRRLHDRARPRIGPHVARAQGGRTTGSSLAEHGRIRARRRTRASGGDMQPNAGRRCSQFERTLRLVVPLAVAGSLVAVGCGQGEVDRAVESSGRSNLALATCDPSLVTWADPNSTISPCAGPFEYFPVCYKSSPRATGPLGGDVACGIDAYVQKTCYPSCRN